MEVAPHPRTKTRDSEGLYPSAWSVSRFSTTYERLAREGATALIQCSSGVGLEALGLGLPVIELAHPGEEPNYPYLAEPFVPVVSCSSGLRDAFVNLDQSDSAAESRIAYAQSWCSADGALASQAAADAICKAAEVLPSNKLILDAWSGLSS